ncbi:metallophosphoesterase [Anthocerotibacter panamensis]|uniref:metallophosphoesterase n=1 Tax=Anthocerotibacter panamensis TaxID=2857077 RepID=UPI001C402B67|nr:metallophosphoesterase [Anthocerotibacter panamensis]
MDIKRRTVVAALAALPLIPRSLAAGERLHVAFIADTGTGSKGQYAVAAQMDRMQARDPFDFILLGGDNIYDDGEIEKIKQVFERPYHALLAAKVPFYAVLGNHDVRTRNGVDQLKYFHMPARYYTFRKGPAQFFALDTNQLDKAQLVWLDEQLGHSEAPAKIVFGHHNVYSSSVYGVAQERVTKLSPILIRHRVALYLNGHEHCYERTYPLDGVVYLTGGGGSEVRPVDKSAFTAFSRSTREFISLEITARQIALAAVDTTGQVFDQALIRL